MILYFSGTGNSRYAAQVIQAETGDEIVSINDCIKKGNRVTIHSKEPFVFVAPTYAWRLPRVVEEFIRNSEFTGNNQAYFLLTCGTHTHDAVHFAKKLCTDKHFTFMGFSSLIMPENYIAMFDAPDKVEAAVIIDKALPVIQALGQRIKNKQTLAAETINLADKLISSATNPLFYKLFVSAKGFYATDACIGCKKCEKVCPLNNVRMNEGKPVWDGNCTHCMACICSCPKEAIEYKKKSQGKPRYYNTGFVRP